MKKTTEIGCPSLTSFPLHSLRKERRYFMRNYSRWTQIDDNELKISQSEYSISEDSILTESYFNCIYIIIISYL